VGGRRISYRQWRDDRDHAPIAGVFRRGSSPTTTAGATTATMRAAARDIRSSTTTAETGQHDNDHPQGPSVTFTLGPGGL